MLYWRGNMKSSIVAVILLFSVVGASAKPIECELLGTSFPGGYTWTLTTRLGQALKMAEELYGRRDHGWTLLGVEFSDNGQPQVWYPGSGEGRSNVVIQLTEGAAKDYTVAMFQLAHEVVHVLSPNGTRGATVLEEGLASYFSLLYVKKHLNRELEPERWVGSKYMRAYQLVARLDQEYEDMPKRIQLLRQRNGGSLSGTLTSRLVQEIFPVLPADDADALAGRF